MSFTLIGESKRRARIAHRCSWCGQPIQVGEVYVRTRFVFEGDPGSNKFHLECDKAAADDYAEWGEGFMPYENERPAKLAVPETEGGPK
jgi:hypothetical protein